VSRVRWYIQPLNHGPFYPSTGSGRTGVHTAATPRRPGSGLLLAMREKNFWFRLLLAMCWKTPGLGCCLRCTGKPWDPASISDMVENHGCRLLLAMHEKNPGYRLLLATCSKTLDAGVCLRCAEKSWIPAFAGMTAGMVRTLRMFRDTTIIAYRAYGIQ